MAKVLALVTFKIYPPEMGGQKGVADFYEYLSRHHSVVLAVSSDNITDKSNVQPILYSNKNIFRNLWNIRKLISLIKKEGINIVIAEHSYPGWIAWLVATSCTIPFVIHSHNIEAKRFQKMNRRWWKVYWHYENWIHGCADHNFFISKDDLSFATRVIPLAEERCSVITYGVDQPPAFTRVDIMEKVLLFSGSLDYQPNEDAVHALIDHINPLLREKLSGYRIAITGKGATDNLIQKMNRCPELEYRGYVTDLRSLFASISVFLNPVLNDTGIKTKVVEAIGSHRAVVSMASGAAGIERSVCGDKLRVVADHDWTSFTNEVIAILSEDQHSTPPEFFRYYLWDNIAAKAASDIDRAISNYKEAHINKRIL